MKKKQENNQRMEEGEAGYSFEVVPGFFIQDDPVTAENTFVPPRFGLKDDSAERWSIFFNRLRDLNATSPAGTSYKLFFFVRHGQAHHNVASAKYGKEKWREYWSRLTGDGELVWGPDSELTAQGKSQAQKIRATLEEELSAGLELPSQLISSPLTRAMSTCQIMFEGLRISDEKKVDVWEDCRETNSVQTCNKRRTRSYITSHFSNFAPEASLTEQDETWGPDVRETREEVEMRVRVVLNRIFGADEEDEEGEGEGEGVEEEEDWRRRKKKSVENDFISITAHAGTINAFTTVLGRDRANLATGSLLPIVVKATRKQISNCKRR